MSEDLIPKTLWISRPKSHIFGKAMHRVRIDRGAAPDCTLQGNKLGNSHYPYVLYYHESEVQALKNRIAELEARGL